MRSLLIPAILLLLVLGCDGRSMQPTGTIEFRYVGEGAEDAVVQFEPASLEGATQWRHGETVTFDTDTEVRAWVVSLRESGRIARWSLGGDRLASGRDATFRVPAGATTLQVELPANVYVLRADGTGDFEGLNEAVAVVESGSVIEMEPGAYPVGTREDPINMNVPIDQTSLTIRSTTGNPSDVVLTYFGVPKGALGTHGPFTVTSATLALEGVTIRNTESDIIDGSALNATDSDVTIRNCVFEGCGIWVAGSGGAIYFEGSTALIEGCEFRLCKVGYSTFEGYGPGGAIFAESTNLRIRGTRFHENGRAGWNTFPGTESGGAIHVEGSGALFVSDCEFEGNHASLGGAIFCAEETELSVADSEFIDNWAGLGGAIHGAGSFRGSVIAHNMGWESGGGIYVPARDGFETLIERCTFYSDSSGTGSSVYHSNPGGSSTVRIKESILAAGVALDTYDGTESEIFVETGGCGLEWECSTLFTTIDPGTPPCEVDGFFTDDPLFCDETTFSLRSDSHCLAENNPCGRTMGAVQGVGCTP